MGVSIAYSASLNGKEIQEAVLSDKVNDFCGDHEWYIEPPNFIMGTNNVSGSSKLFRLYDTDGSELDPSEESPKVLRDIEILVNSFTESAKLFSINWELSIEDAPIGCIGIDGPDPAFNQTLTEMIIVFGGGMSDGSIDQIMPKEEPIKQPSKPWWKIW